MDKGCLFCNMMGMPKLKEINFYNVYDFIKDCSYDNLKSIVLDALKVVDFMEGVYE